MSNLGTSDKMLSNTLWLLVTVSSTCFIMPSFVCCFGWTGLGINMDCTLSFTHNSSSILLPTFYCSNIAMIITSVFYHIFHVILSLDIDRVYTLAVNVCFLIHWRRFDRNVRAVCGPDNIWEVCNSMESLFIIISSQCGRISREANERGLQFDQCVC